MKKVCIIRNGAIGDLAVIKPYLNFYTRKNNISHSSIYLIAITVCPLSTVKQIFYEFARINIRKINSNQPKIISLIQLVCYIIRMKITLKPIEFCYIPFISDDRLIQKVLYAILSVFSVNIARTCSENYKKPNQYNHFMSSTDWEKSKNLYLKNNNKIHRNYVFIYAASKLCLKKWHWNNYVKVIDSIQDHFSDKYKIVLVGGIEDVSYNDMIRDNTKKRNVVNFAGKLNLIGLQKLLKKCKLYIGNDGSPMHFAALSGSQVIAIFSRREPLPSWEPIICNNYEIISSNVPCSNCYKVVCDNNICINKIQVNEVTNIIHNYLE